MLCTSGPVCRSFHNLVELFRVKLCNNHTRSCTSCHRRRPPATPEFEDVRHRDEDSLVEQPVCFDAVDAVEVSSSVAVTVTSFRPGKLNYLIEHGILLSSDFELGKDILVFVVFMVGILRCITY